MFLLKILLILSNVSVVNLVIYALSKEFCR
jgi:hypothetical protein